MKNKSRKAVEFLTSLHEYITTHKSLRNDTQKKTEQAIQTEIRPLIINFLEDYFKKLGYKDYIAKANNAFYWEGQEGNSDKNRTIVFNSRNYPDFIIKSPYLIAIEYKKSTYGTVVKHAIGQAIIHTMCNEYDYVYCLFKDENTDNRIIDTLNNNYEREIIANIWENFNVFFRIIGNKKKKGESK